jgi:hypothetical protein
LGVFPARARTERVAARRDGRQRRGAPKRGATDHRRPLATVETRREPACQERSPTRRSGTFLTVDEDPTTEELRLQQLQRERVERERAERAASEDDAEAHARRAEKTAYLRERLEERAEAERRAEDEPEGDHPPQGPEP